MTRSTYAIVCALAAALLFASLNLGTAQAMSRAVALQASPRLPLTLSSVFCGAAGCLPVTRVKHCAPDTTNRNAPAQRAVIVRNTCNFL